jgi:CO/xanthine dehydrogenase FAD-binding subunit
MDAQPNQVFFPNTLPELFTVWNRFPNAVPFAGGTFLARAQEGRRTLNLPANILSLDRLDELRRVTRTERYIEIGAMVKLNEIINLGKIIPEAFTLALKNIAGPEIRNLATIGGNICNPGRRLDASAPLIALDARYELRTAQAARWISASRFSSLSGPPAINPQELLTRLRIPLEQWNYSMYKKFRDRDRDNEFGGSIVFIARIQKDILTDIRVVFTGESVLRDKNSEAVISGRRLPLERRDANHFVELWRTYLSAVEAPGPLMRAKMLNFIESGILGLAD